ncbi:DNA-directed RNA polymerase subunit alpha [Helicobacter heilmannii]|uniref:DNA-directed RNA polymerase subunit alpha n=1 Tax=Helicobacter heilmannii TaxID=35817 RepID=A0A0K2Y9Q8_HELHE|nr:DNA-directed RNA polymerase subunit alpha [Helicobacter heilmannii]BDQ26988.1 DNA-directed RNA polymerase subunit alpha [Helicobacter heilmannii]CCM12426.1 DNA-directed RNA polymerase alpha subunit [Helicobacter heilmannii ASB1.4]CRI34429.1 DNA-directed RNA polymerase alpha subunit [Helicobacter heilmannii]
MKVIKTAPHVPTDISVEKISNRQIRICVSAFESGYAITLAHPIRRLLLQSSVGYAPIGIKIENVAHEFDSVRGMSEDVALFIANLKNIRLIGQTNNPDEQLVVHYSFKGPAKLSGKHLETEGVQVVDQEAYLATINEDVQLDFALIIQRGMGYVPSESIRGLIPSDYIPLDAYFTPIKKVFYNIEHMLVDGNPNFERVVFDIESDGQIDPQTAFQEAVKTMHAQMHIFSTSMAHSKVYALEDSLEVKELVRKVEDLDLSARCFNCLDKIGIKYIGELVLMDAYELKGIKNLGKKSYDEIAEKLEQLKYPVGQELSPEFKASLKARIDKLKSEEN